MRITFDNDSETAIELMQKENGIVLFAAEPNNCIGYEMNVEQLHDFIGSLLHLQQKIKKGGSNV